jgi:hypothetical protein
MCAVAAMILSRVAIAQPPDCPWRFATGHWKASDETGNESEVVWKTTEGDALLGLWMGKDGKATEIAGWRSDTKELVVTGYGPKGEYWDVLFTTFTENMIKGKMIQRTAEGVVMRGIWQVTKKSDDEMDTLFVGTANGKEVTIKGSFKRVK